MTATILDRKTAAAQCWAHLEQINRQCLPDSLEEITEAWIDEVFHCADEPLFQAYQCLCWKDIQGLATDLRDVLHGAYADAWYDQQARWNDYR